MLNSLTTFLMLFMILSDFISTALSHTWVKQICLLTSHGFFLHLIDYLRGNNELLTDFLISIDVELIFSSLHICCISWTWESSYNSFHSVKWTWRYCYMLIWSDLYDQSAGSWLNIWKSYIMCFCWKPNSSSISKEWAHHFIR